MIAVPQAGRWIVASVVGFTIMAASSRLPLRHALIVADKLRAPSFLIGITLMAVGTDLPELFNSIVASYFGHGDINVVDSIGSVFTQGSIIGLFPFLTGYAIPVERRQVILIPGLTIVALTAGGIVMADGEIDRPDATILVALWIALTAIAWRCVGGHRVDGDTPEQMANRAGGHARILPGRRIPLGRRGAAPVPDADHCELRDAGAVVAGLTMLLIAVLIGMRRRIDRGADALLVLAYALAYAFLPTPA